MSRKSDKFNAKSIILAGLTPKQVLEKTIFSTKAPKKPQQQLHIPGTLGTTSEFDRFWSLIENDRKSCTQLISGFLEYLLSVVEKKKKMPPGITLGSMLNTIQFLILFYSYDVTKAEILALKDEIATGLSKKQSDKLNDTSVKTTQVMKMLNLQVDLLSGKEEGPDTIVRWFINWCATLYTPEEFNVLRNYVECPSYDPAQKKGGEHVFLFQYLLKYMPHSQGMFDEENAHNPDYLGPMLDNIIKRISAIPQVMKMNPLVAEIQLLSYMQMLKTLLVMGDMESQQMATAIKNMQPFLLWPKPICDDAKTLLFQMEKESLLPGESIREALHAESFCARSKAECGPLQQKEAIVYYLMNSKCHSTSVISHIMGIELDTKDSGKKIGPRLKVGQQSVRMMGLMVLNMLNRDIPISPKDIEDFGKLSEESVQSQYDECIAVIEHIRKEAANGFTPEESQSYRTEKFSEIKSKWGQLEQNKEDLETKISSIFTGIDMLKLHDKGFPLLKPPVYNKALSSDLNYTIQTPEQRKLSYETEVLPPIPDLYEPLLDVIKKKQMFGASPENKLHLRLALAGGDRLMHSALCAYTRLLRSEPTVAEAVDFAFYVIPMAQNHLACWLARHDSWYNRHVYIPFWSDRFLLPWVQRDPLEPPPRQAISGMITKFFTSVADSYIHHAARTLNIKVWSCKVYNRAQKWNPKASNESKRRKNDSEPQPAFKGEPSQIFPFFQRLEIGYGAELARYCQTEEDKMRSQLKKLNHKKQLTSQESKDVLRLKTEMRPENKDALWKRFEDKFSNERKFKTPELKIRFSKVGLDGKIVKTVMEPLPLSFQQIVLSNVPRHGDSGGFPPNPEDPWLEMYAKTAVSHQGKKVALNAEPAQHVSRVEISVRGTERFSILVDGQLFPSTGESGQSEGYQSLVVNKYIQDGKQLNFPVQTFFPVTI